MESLGDVFFEVAGMVVLLPVLADASVDERRANGQAHHRSARDRLHMLIHVKKFCGKSNIRIPFFDHPRPQDILGLEFPGVPEGGSATLAQESPSTLASRRLSLRDLAIAVVRPAFRCKTSTGGGEPRFILVSQGRPKDWAAKVRC